jgi:hypothetical protein
MENKIYNDDVERIVNEPNRQQIINERYYNRQMHRQQKMIFNAIIYAGIAVVFGVFGVMDWVTPWFAFPVFATCGIWSAFCVGRWFEHAKHWGWN